MNIKVDVVILIINNNFKNSFFICMKQKSGYVLYY